MSVRSTAGPTLFFYDLETSGINPRADRVMQFAGQRTDTDLNPIGDPFNIIIRLSSDVLPDPRAVLITGITPQQTLADGISEYEFLKVFHTEVATPGTVFVGYNNVRFDDEFMRFMLYRNFYDAYTWQWKDDRSRWDLLDVIRMTRALRPDGIKWPVDVGGVATNRLELLTAENGLDHAHAHDALNDVYATIALAKLVKEKQPKLFSFLLDARHKKTVSHIVDSDKPFIYTSGKYDAKTEKTTVALKLGPHPGRQSGSSLVFDLRFDPLDFVKLSATELSECMRRKKNDLGLRLPVKTLQYNRCPAVAPVSVLDSASQERLQVDMKIIAKNHATLTKHKDILYQKTVEALSLLDELRASQDEDTTTPVDTRLYEGFFSEKDSQAMTAIQSRGLDAIDDARQLIKDDRLAQLLPLYKARNFPESMSSDEHEAWEAHRRHVLFAGGDNSKLAQYFTALSMLAKDESLNPEKRFILEELQLYGQSIMPDIDS